MDTRTPTLMETLTDTTPAAPSDIDWTPPRDAKPSELIRGWPERQWCAGWGKRSEPGGPDRFCAIGILAEHLGMAWDDPIAPGFAPGTRYNAPLEQVAQAFDIPRPIVDTVICVNDRDGKDAAADYLASWGF